MIEKGRNELKECPTINTCQISSHAKIFRRFKYIAAKNTKYFYSLATATSISRVHNNSNENLLLVLIWGISLKLESRTMKALQL